jgi:hypothetical protein
MLRSVGSTENFNVGGCKHSLNDSTIHSCKAFTKLDVSNISYSTYVCLAAVALASQKRAYWWKGHSPTNKYRV